MSDRAAEDPAAEEDPTSDVGLSGASTFDTSRFREVLGHFTSGITVITGVDRAGPVGFTCQSFMSVSLDPPLIAFAPSRTSASWPRIEAVGAFCVNVLSQEQETLSRVFATKDPDKFGGIGWRRAATGSPVLDRVLAWIDCRIEGVHEAGDHLLVLGRVQELGLGEGEPLLFYRAGYGRFEA
ncbi:MAG TPA: flavin reductase [Acidimicrobiales bacterium]|nr:flavin reductase [Acidimicrobiales bacterium]